MDRLRSIWNGIKWLVKQFVCDEPHGKPLLGPWDDPQGGLPRKR